MHLFRHSLKVRLLLGSLFILLISLLLSGLLSLYSFTNLQQQQAVEALHEHLQYLKNQQYRYEDLDEYARSFSLRITHIGSSGKVLYDSAVNPENMDNHLTREEIQRSISEERGISTRSSVHVNELLIYVAVKTDDGSFLRLSRSYAFTQEWTKYHLRMLVASFLILGVLTFLMILLNTRIATKALSILTDTAEHYQRGNLSHRSVINQPTEYALLSQTLNSMAQQLQVTFSELNASSIKYQALLNAMQDGVALLDQNHTILISNTAFDRMFNEGENSEGSTIDHLLDNQQASSVIDDALASESLRTSIIMQHEKQYQITPSPILKHGKGVQALVVTINDVTTLRRLEQIRKDFVANVSHELKTPLTAITGFSELASQEQTTMEQLRFFNSIIFSNTKRMQTLVEDLLLLASLEDGKTEIPRFSVDVASLVEQAIDGCKYLANQKQITINYTPKAGFFVLANEGLLVQAVMNLLSNAISYSDINTSVHINVKQMQNHVSIAVTDNGCGIAKEDQQRIFERFYRVDKARSRKEGGTGLGLAIVKHIATIHNGRVEVQSTVGKGSTFTLFVTAVNG